MEVLLTMALNGIARCMTPSGLKKILSFSVVELALRDDEVVRSVSQARGQQQRPLRPRFVEQSLVPEMVQQLVEVPKVTYQDGIQRRTAEHIVDRPAPVLAGAKFLRGSVDMVRGYRIDLISQAKTRVCCAQWSAPLWTLSG